MSYALVADLDPWFWGYVVVQERYDGPEFCQLLRQAGCTEDFLKIYWSAYANLGNCGGYCDVPSRHVIPWLIVITTPGRYDQFKTMVHEAVHLGERLSQRHGVPLAVSSKEVRANIVAKVVALFHRDYERRHLAAVDVTQEGTNSTDWRAAADAKREEFMKWSREHTKKYQEFMKQREESKKEHEAAMNRLKQLDRDIERLASAGARPRLTSEGHRLLDLTPISQPAPQLFYLPPQVPKQLPKPNPPRPPGLPDLRPRGLKQLPKPIPPRPSRLPDLRPQGPKLLPKPNKAEKR